MVSNNNNYAYFTRELSWLSFNERVLNEGTDVTLSVHDRLKFLAIYTSNLNEFLKVRVAGIRLLAEKDPGGQHALDLEDINQEVARLQKRFYTILERDILPELKKEGLGMYKYYNYSEHAKEFAELYFEEKLSKYIHPILLTNTSLVPYVEDSKIYVAVQLIKMKKDGTLGKKQLYGYVDVPTELVGRFVVYTDPKGKTKILLLEDIIKHNISKLFPGYVSKNSHVFTLLRDADIEIEDEYHGDLVQKIKEAILKRETGIPCRFSYEASMPLKMLMAFRSRLNLSSEDLSVSYGYSCFQDFMSYPRKEKDYTRKLSVPSSTLSFDLPLLPQIESRDHLLHFPYHSYDYVLRFLNEVAIKSQVYEIMTTQYRVANDSAVVNALINAARNGKKVTVFVEAKARFDEERNLFYAEKMKSAGVNIVYSMPKIKVHAKIILVNARSKSNVEKSYAFISTGNFNEKTAELYTDHGLFTVDEDICSDLKTLFGMVSNSVIEDVPFKCIVNSPFNTRKRIIELIEQEIKHSEAGRKARVILKMNGLQDKETIDSLYRASEAGVQVELIVRGICCLKPNQPYSKNIKLIRIVDKFLEHGRIYWFYNNRRPEVLIGSADIMQRNLDKRIEVLIPIKRRTLEREIYKLLQMFLSDNTKACYIDEFLKNKKVDRGRRKVVRAQIAIEEYLNSLNN